MRSRHNYFLWLTTILTGRSGFAMAIGITTVFFGRASTPISTGSTTALTRGGGTTGQQ